MSWICVYSRSGLQRQKFNGCYAFKKSANLKYLSFYKRCYLCSNSGCLILEPRFSNARRPQKYSFLEGTGGQLLPSAYPLRNYKTDASEIPTFWRNLDIQWISAMRQSNGFYFLCNKALRKLLCVDPCLERLSVTLEDKRGWNVKSGYSLSYWMYNQWNWINLQFARDPLTTFEAPWGASWTSVWELLTLISVPCALIWFPTMLLS